MNKVRVLTAAEKLISNCQKLSSRNMPENYGQNTDIPIQKIAKKSSSSENPEIANRRMLL